MPNGKKEQAYEIIKQKILSGELPPSTDLSEEKLIQELSISRTPIREAVQKLNEEGFVSIYPRKGTIVSEITLDVIHWVYEARLLNEPYITKLACGRISIDWLMRMQKAFQEILNDSGQRNSQSKAHYIELDRELHGQILETCPNIFLRSFMRNIYDHSHRFRIKTGSSNQEYGRAVVEHLDILEALLEGNPDLAEKTARKHVLEATKTAYRYH